MTHLRFRRGTSVARSVCLLMLSCAVGSACGSSSNVGVADGETSSATTVVASNQVEPVSEDRVKARVRLDDASIQAFLKVAEPADIIQKLIELPVGSPFAAVVSHQTELTITFLFGILSSVPLGDDGISTTTVVLPSPLSDKADPSEVSTTTTLSVADAAALQPELAVTDIVTVKRTEDEMSSLNAKLCRIGGLVDWNVVAVVAGETLKDENGSYREAQRAWTYDEVGLHEIDASKVRCETVVGD